MAHTLLYAYMGAFDKSVLVSQSRQAEINYGKHIGVFMELKGKIV